MDPVSIITVVVVALASAAAGATVTANWDSIVIWWKGKKVGILGAEESGKTTLLSFLKEGSIPTEYDETLGAIPSKAKRVKIRDLELLLQAGKDVGGRRRARDQNWRDIVLESDIILYLIRAHELDQRSLTERIREDAEMIEGWIREREKPPTIAIVGTHADCDERFLSASRKELENLFEQNDEIRRLVVLFGGSQRTLVLLGSLKTLDDSERLAFALLSQLSQ